MIWFGNEGHFGVMINKDYPIIVQHFDEIE